MSRKLRMIIFWMFLGLGFGLGGPYDPKQTDDIVRIMNETKIEVVLDKGDGPPDGYKLEPTMASWPNPKVPEARKARRINGAGR